MRAFLDFEASSLADDSYPIEVAWVFEDARSESHLIRPAPAWTDWDPEAAALHGLTRERLGSEGEPHEAVANRVLEALGPHEVYVSAPSWDGKWLSVLLRAAGLPRHAMRFKPTAEAHAAAIASAWGREPAPEEIEEIVTFARVSVATEPVRHRALADAEQELRLWREIGRLAATHAPSPQNGVAGSQPPS